MRKTEADLAATVQGWLQKADTLDVCEEYTEGPNASRKRIADVSREQPGATGENSTRQGRTGSRNPCECGGRTIVRILIDGS